jgi:hypothetical protein
MRKSLLLKLAQFSASETKLIFPTLAWRSEMDQPLIAVGSCF